MFKWPKNGNLHSLFFGSNVQHKLQESNKNITEDLDRWSALPLSLIGRIESIRMNVLPRFLYLFQMLPIEVPKSTFDLLNKNINKFIRQRKQPRIRLKTKQSCKNNGGLGLPNFSVCFWAA